MKSNKRNRYPFIVLLIIHGALIFYTFYKHKDRKSLLILLFSNIGLAYLFEYFVFTLFKAYCYRPYFFKREYIDNTLGAILSQAIYVPFTAVFITASQWGWKVKWLFSFYFSVVEVLFLRLRVYQHHWWRVIYTTVLLPIFFFISDWWYKQIKKGTPFVLSISLVNIILVTSTNIMYVFALLRKIRFGRGKWHSWSEHFHISPLYTLAQALFTVWSIRDGSWWSKVRVVLFGVMLDWTLKTLGILKMNFYYPYMNIVLNSFMIFLSVRYKHWVDQQSI
ncbi:hypothetical protein [Ammoniphilus sp. 3BR4]|uniref:hypothetical protein n=1 Tax=Ammoniphilus sp. 3BR4 TaxID=3158265 RepID=UPI003465DF49